MFVDFDMTQRTGLEDKFLFCAFAAVSACHVLQSAICCLEGSVLRLVYMHPANLPH